MKIAIVTAPGQCASMSGWIAENVPGAAELEHWIIDPVADVVEQVLDVLTAQWLQTPVDILIFPAGPTGDALATRLAWRLHGGSACQALALDAPQGLVSKAHWGNALTATLHIAERPLCLSLARQPEVNELRHSLPTMKERHIVPVAVPDWLESVESVRGTATHPLLAASRVLVIGQGNADVSGEKTIALGEALHAEVGYSRARVMNGGVDADCLVGISGHLLSPDVCIVAGASGASALMAGVRQSRFIVAINNDPGAPVFSQADVGIVDDWLPVLEALVASAKG